MPGSSHKSCRMWLLTWLSYEWCSYQLTTYRMISLNLIHLMILWTGYFDLLVLSLCYSSAKGGSRIIGNGSLVAFDCRINLVCCSGNTVSDHCVIDAVFINGDRIHRGWDYPERSNGFRQQFGAWLLGGTSSWRGLLRRVIGKYLLAWYQCLIDLNRLVNKAFATHLSFLQLLVFNWLEEGKFLQKGVAKSAGIWRCWNIGQCWRWRWRIQDDRNRRVTS